MPFDAENTKNSENFKSSTLIFVRLFFSFTISFLHLLSPPCFSYFIFCDLYFCSDTPDIKTKSVLAEILHSFVFFSQVFGFTKRVNQSSVEMGQPRGMVFIE